MSKKSMVGRFLRSTMLSGVAAAAAAPVALVATSAILSPAAAQDYTSGAIAGNVVDASGNPVGGATVTIRSLDQGFSRSATSSSSGGFRFSSLPPGNYELTASSGGQTETIDSVRVAASATSNFTLALGTPASSGDEVVVTGTRQNFDFSNTTTGVSLDVENLVKEVPIGRDLTSLTLLAPGTSLGDSAFGNLSSVGGSSVAENAYYVNGLNTTNFDNYLGSAEVPFEFYKSVEVKTGGYPAEFGRATGGIINAVTKQGSNDFFAAVHLNWAPNALRSSEPDIQNCSYDSAVPAGWDGVSALPSISCTNATNRKSDTEDSYSAIIEAGGPIIKDRLFVYGLLELREERSLENRVTLGTAYDRTNNDPFWGLKVDAYPIDDHHFEFTMFDTRKTTVRNDLSYSLDPVTGEDVYGTANSVNEFNYGGLNFVAKYTGRMTEWLTLSTAYGRVQDRFDNIGTAGAAGLPRVRNNSGGTINGVPNGGNFTAQSVTSTSFPYDTERKFWRADADLFFNFIGDHHVRGGFDLETNTLSKASVRNGANYLLANGIISPAAYNAGLGGAGMFFDVLTTNTVQLNYFNSYGAFDAKNRAFYIQDDWNITDRLTLSLGVRRDDFKVYTADANILADQSGNYAPRVGFSYDLWGDGSGKLYGSFGNYYLPFASNTSFRMTGYELYFRELWNFSGFNGAGVPILTTQLGPTGSYASACPFGLTPGSSGGNVCSVTGDGTVAPSEALLARNLKATKEREFIIGYEHKLNDLWTLGINYTRRNLLTTAEDAAIDAAVLNYCADQGITGCSSTWTGFHQYVIINPGQEAEIVLDGLDGRTVTFTAEELGYPAATRTYDAVEFTFERAFDGRWSLKGSYSWSESRGNSEGFVQSDFGQTDAGITQDFDQPTFVDGAEGLLPNHRRHRIKFWGSYAVTDQLSFGTNVQFASPRPLSCFGFHPENGYNNFGNLYGAASHYCGGVISPRGTAQQSDWQKNVNVSMRYNIDIPSGQLLTLRADVFNIFNFDGATERNEIGDLRNPATFGDATPVPSPNYGQATAYQEPRYVRLGLDINF